MAPRFRRAYIEHRKLCRSVLPSPPRRQVGQGIPDDPLVDRRQRAGQGRARGVCCAQLSALRADSCPVSGCRGALLADCGAPVVGRYRVLHRSRMTVSLLTPSRIASTLRRSASVRFISKVMARFMFPGTARRLLPVRDRTLGDLPRRRHGTPRLRRCRLRESKLTGILPGVLRRRTMIGGVYCKRGSAGRAASLTSAVDALVCNVGPHGELDSRSGAAAHP